MSRKVKCLPYLIIQRVWNSEKTILILLALSLAVVFLKDYGNSFTIQLFLKDIIEMIVFAKETWFAIAVSLLSGIIVYFLTIVVPEVRKRKSLLVEIERTLLDLKTSFIDLATEMQIGDYKNPETCAKNAVNNVKKWCCRVSEYDDYNLNRFRSHFESLRTSFVRLTEYMLGYSSILSEKEIDMIIDIRQRKVSKRIVFLDGVDNCLNVDEISDFFKGIANLYNDVCIFHDKIVKSIYK